MKPVLQALVLAEKVYEEKGGKKIIAGTFNKLLFTKGLPTAKEQKPEELPDGSTRVVVKGGQLGSPYVYLSLTDVCDGTRLILQFVNLSKNKVLFETEILLKGKDRLATVEIVAPLPPWAHFGVSEAGAYAFEVVCDGEIIGSHRVIAEEVKGE